MLILISKLERVRVIGSETKRAGTREVPHFPQIKSVQGIFGAGICVCVYCKRVCARVYVCVCKVEGELGSFDTDVNVEKQKQHTHHPYPYICYT